MRIINRPEYYDYYDHAVPYVPDDETVFDRNKIADLVLLRPSDTLNEIQLTDEFCPRVEFAVLGFCGKTYIIAEYLKHPRYVLGRPRKKIVCKSVDEVEYELKVRFRKSERLRVTRLFEIFSESSAYLDLFTTNSTPIFFASFTTVWQKWMERANQSNFKLKDVVFERIFPAAQAYQEIEMFIANVLNNKAETPVSVSNEAKILKSGFDLKTSFRNPINPKTK